MRNATSSDRLTYVYIDYTTEEVPRPFYVGIGYKGRTKDFKRNCKHKGVSKKYGRQRRIVYGTCDREEAEVLEQLYIADLKTRESASHLGCNFTDGGEGASGLAVTEEHRQKLSIALKGRKSSKKGRKLSEEHKQKLSITQKGRKSPNKGKKLSEDTKEKMCLAKKGKKRTEEARRALSQYYSNNRLFWSLYRGNNLLQDIE